MFRAILLLLASGSALLAQPSPDPSTVFPGTADLPPFVTLWQVIQSGGWVMIPLGVLSIIGCTLVLVFFLTLNRGTVVTTRYLRAAESHLHRGDVPGLLALSTRHGEAVARVTRRTLDFAQRNPHAHFKLIREVAETEGARQAGVLYQRISYLADVGTIAPMVGLLGTVIGMIQAFTVLAGDIAASRPMLLAEGVSTALITTAAGLIIGIPALAFYAYFRGRVTRMVADLEAASTEILALIATHYDRADSSGVPALVSNAPAPAGPRTQSTAAPSPRRSVFDDDI